MVREFLNDMGRHESQEERLRELERLVRASITNFSASENIPRDELYDRSL